MSFSRSVAGHCDEKGPIIWLAFILPSKNLSTYGLNHISAFDLKHDVTL